MGIFENMLILKAVLLTAVCIFVQVIINAVFFKNKKVLETASFERLMDFIVSALNTLLFIYIIYALFKINY